MFLRDAALLCMSSALRQNDTVDEIDADLPAMAINVLSCSVIAPSDSPPPCLLRPLRLDACVVGTV